ncbi:TPA: HslU--HslV peptidase ATPase subunit [bacterium]|nr:HslU--HslV peptidase ATPase subunit [bacterium]
MRHFTPTEIVSWLDKYIVGQAEAKKAVAIAIRNRYRRNMLQDDLKDEVCPKNILMIGPTGVGKTEISRRVAMLSNFPFIKVEATKFTEVGYVGRDVESMIRDLVSLTVNTIKTKEQESIRDKAEEFVEEKLLSLLLPGNLRGPSRDETKEKLRKILREGKMEKRFVDIETKEAFPMVEVFATAGMESMIDQGLFDTLGNIFPGKKKKRKVTVSEARDILFQEECEKLIDKDKVIREAVSKVENEGIIFLDELDKITGNNSSYGPDISREGVQRDLLPIVEGSTVMTRYGPVKTNHILFIAAGTFTSSKPSDLIPELQGRFPIRVELSPLNKEDLKLILTKPENALIRQYKALLKTEGIELEFTEDGVDEIAEITSQVNTKTDDIGARRLYTIMEKLLEDVSYKAPDIPEKNVVIDRKYIKEKLSKIIEDQDLTKYIL